MPMFSMPDMPTPMTMLDDMTRQTTAMMPAEFASTVNLMAHPIAGAAALSAIGAGMAGHAIGFWFGAMSGAAVASQRALLQFADAEMADVDSFRDASRTPDVRATETATALIAEVDAATPASAKIRRLTPRTKRAAPQVKPAEDVAPEVATESPVEAAPEAPSVDPVAPVEEKTDTAGEMPTVESPAESATESAAAPRRPAALDRPEQPDDLKAISGIGPKLEQVLNGMGIWTYAQIAGWDGAETAWLGDALGFRGRIERDGWVAQAAKLAGQGG